ncbi:nuclear cap-binding protein subunit 3-like [Belonocnema kinseyi]|uniref:nuclear cap-binding protein subunit 3-like n=1 Tax=Belonocnema kinseyi TaxID=2817044 RepID=UPI00143D5175|nr:nuclear cap-binding protein subunit 3-like [Belonocnema kinseyi]
MTGIDIFSKEEKQKIEERAKRFGLTDKEIFSHLEEYQDLYSSMGITEENESTKNFRLNVLHIRGTEEMSTKDVFKYFEDYAPASIEWINDVSCNLVWLDSASTARALLGLSKKIIGVGNRTRTDLSPKSNDSNNECVIEVDTEDKIEAIDDKMDENVTSEKEIHVKNINYPLPPGIWRKGIDCPKSKGIFMRFAIRSEKKQHAEKMSEYYKKYGNPNFGVKTRSSVSTRGKRESRKNST